MILGWIYVLGLYAIGLLLLSIGGVGFLGLLPFAACAVYALIDRARRAFTPLGFVCVVLAALPVAGTTALAVAYVDDGDGYVVFLFIMIVAASFVSLEVAQGLRRRRRAARDR